MHASRKLAMRARCRSCPGSLGRLSATSERFRGDLPADSRQFGASTVVKPAWLRENDCVPIAPRLAAVGLALVAFVLIAGGRVLDRIAAEQHVPESGSLWLYPFLVAAVSAPAAVGALIVGRRPHNPIGWILVVGALSLAAVLAAQPYAWVALEAHPGSLPGGSWAALVSSLWPAFFAWPLAVAFVFPDGRLPSSRWRPYALFAAGSMALLVLMLVLADQLEPPFSKVPNPFPLRLPDALGFLRSLAWLSVFASLFVGAAAARTATSAPREASGCSCFGWPTRRS